MSEITKIQVNGTEYDLPKAPARVSLYIDVPQNPSFPIMGTLTSSQQNEITKTSAPVIAVQVATSQSDMVETYYCYCNYLTPHCGLYGSDFYGQYDDTTLLHIKIEHNQSYTISKVSAGSGSSGVSSFGGKTGAIALSDDFEMNGNTLKFSATGGGSGGNPTNGFYPYNAKIVDNPTVGSTYSYADSNVTYPTGCSYFQGQMIIDTNGAIYKVIGTTMCNCVYVPQSGGSTYSVVEITSSTSTLTDEQYNTLTASPFNKIKLSNELYDLYKETSTELVYTANYFNNGYQITIKKDTKTVSTGSLSSLIAISAFVKNDLNYNQSNNRFALSAYQGKVLNDRLTAVENGGGGTLYQHTLTYNSDKFSETDQFSGADVQGSFSISFYSTHGHFENASDFWVWLLDKGSIDVYDGQLWGSMGGGTAFTRITVLGNTAPEKYISFESYGGYGSWSPINYYLKNPDATGLTDTITDGFRDM